MTVRVKICGIKTLEMARFCAKAGADYIGIVMCEKSPRYVNLNKARLIARAANDAGVIPVAVFRDSDVNTITEICRDLNVLHVQHHGDLSVLDQLSDEFHKIYVMPLQSFEPGLRSLARNDEDFLMFDSSRPGTGEKIDWTLIKAPLNVRFFVAGGLTVDNVSQAIAITKPFAVDVSSGVEQNGEKSEFLIQQFINKVHHG